MYCVLGGHDLYAGYVQILLADFVQENNISAQCCCIADRCSIQTEIPLCSSPYNFGLIQLKHQSNSHWCCQTTTVLLVQAKRVLMCLSVVDMGMGYEWFVQIRAVNSRAGSTTAFGQVVG